jgi:hypothetical protein
MLVASFAVSVSVIDLFFRGIPNLTDGNIEVQRHTGQFMIAIDGHCLVRDLDDRHDHRPIVRIDLELHAEF